MRSYCLQSLSHIVFEGNEQRDKLLVRRRTSESENINTKFKLDRTVGSNQHSAASNITIETETVYAVCERIVRRTTIAYLMQTTKCILIHKYNEMAI